MIDDEERCYRAVLSRDPRFDGWVYTAVTTTGVYCRPSCPATTPKRAHVRFFPTAAAAQQAGFRACKRCRPDASPGSPAWDVRADAVGRAMRLIGDGVVDRHGVGGLAGMLGYSTRQVERLLVAAVGTGPLALARAQRAQTARVLIETTALPMAQVAFAAGFSSVRQFNDTVQAVFATTPSGLRRRAAGRVGRPAEADGRTAGPAELAGQTVALRLPFRAPLAPGNLFGHLAATAAPGVEEVRDGAYRRVLRLPHGFGVAELRPQGDHVRAALTLGQLRDLGAAVARCRRLLDLDADPEAVDDLLGTDPTLAPLVAATPGRRVPRTVDEAELACRVVLGQQVSTAAASALAGRLAGELGQPVADPAGGLSRAFPDPATLAAALGRTGEGTTGDVAAGGTTGLGPARPGGPRSRTGALRALAVGLAEGRIDLGPGCDWGRARRQLLAVPGIGPWTVEMIAMRALGDPDALPVGDLGLRRAATAAGLPASPAALADRSTRWRPWRAYAAQYLWGTLDHPINRFPPRGGTEPTRSAA